MALPLDNFVRTFLLFLTSISVLQLVQPTFLPTFTSVILGVCLAPLRALVGAFNTFVYDNIISQRYTWWFCLGFTFFTYLWTVSESRKSTGSSRRLIQASNTCLSLVKAKLARYFDMSAPLWMQGEAQRERADHNEARIGDLEDQLRAREREKSGLKIEVVSQCLDRCFASAQTH